MRAYDKVHGTNDAPEVPWWVDYLMRAERWGCCPWELYDGRDAKRFWLECDDMWQRAHSSARNVTQRDVDDS